MTTLDVDDTIVAIASPPGGAMRGIIRVSGPQTMRCLGQVFQSEDSLPISDIKNRRAICGDLRLNETARLPGTLLVWPNDRSYTRQPTAEFHTLGSPPLLQMATALICRAGARLADRGEFTLRAFLSGRIDLTQAEAVLAVIESQGPSQLDSALRQLSGGLSGPLAEIRESLIGVLAELEAGLDFVEEDIEFISMEELANGLTLAHDQLAAINEQIRLRNINRSAFTVAMVGPPNVGKSSLFNVLLEDDRAIVANVQGTTRDFLTANQIWDDLQVELIDTAGLDDSLDDSTAKGETDIHSQAQFQSQQIVDQSDLILLCAEATGFEELIHEFEQQLNRRGKESIVIVITKTDLLRGDDEQAINEWSGKLKSIGYADQVIATSSIGLNGISRLRAAIIEKAQTSDLSESTFVSTTATRAANSLESAQKSVQLALDAVVEELGLELVAAELRQSLIDLGSVIGTVYTDDILDQIFGRFCIGK